MRPELTGHTPNFDVFQVQDHDGNKSFVTVIGLWDRMSATLLAAARARRAADLMGICPLCPYRRGAGQLHAPGCAADTKNMELLLAQWERYYRPVRGRRIVENPADTVSTAVFGRTAAQILGEFSAGVAAYRGNH